MSLVIEEKLGRVCLLTLNRPERKNALNAPLVIELEAKLKQWSDEDDISAICLQGAGQTFCSGADLKELTKTEDVLVMNEKFCSILQLLKSARKPTVALVEGHCMGGGLGLALACDLTYASSDAYLATPEIKHGLWPFMISPLILENMPRKKALDMMLTGGGYSATDAWQLGLVAKVIDGGNMTDFRTQLFEQLSSFDPFVLEAGKKSLETAKRPLPEALPVLAKELFALAKRRAQKSG